MAAGLGFKDFTTGEVLTAADVDGYLMQGVWVFASAAARDAAVTSPQEGNFAYLKDTNVTTYYTGSAWANLDTTGMTNPMTTTGDTIYSSSGSTPARLGIGTAGQVLKVNSGATAPEWGTAASGALTKITSASFTNVASVDVDGCFTSTYKRYFVIVKSFAATVADDFQMQWRESGVTKTSGYFGGNYGTNRDNTKEDMGFSNQAAITLSSTSGISNSNPGNYSFHIDNVGTGGTLSARFWGTGFQGDNAQQALWFGGQGSGAVTGFRLKSSSSNITGEYAVYGLEN